MGCLGEPEPKIVSQGFESRQHPADLWKLLEDLPSALLVAPMLQKQTGKECGSGDSKPQHTVLLKPYKSLTGSHN